jgi:glucokinase
MGAGFILNGQLYAGASDLAGEVGHIRLEEHGPTGHGKAGSFEGFCSGGGIAQIASQLAEDAIRSGTPPLYCPTLADLPFITAETVARAVHQGDLVAHMVFEIVAHQLGRGLAILIDILNPQLIIIGSIYTRQQALLEPLVMDVLRAEVLPQSLSACQIVPSALAESLGDLASLSVALDLIQ